MILKVFDPLRTRLCRKKLNHKQSIAEVYPVYLNKEPQMSREGIGFLKAILHNFRKYRDQKTAKTKSQ